MNIRELMQDAIANGGGTYLISREYNYPAQVRTVELSVAFDRTMEEEQGYWVSAPRGIENMPFLTEALLNQIAGQHVPGDGYPYLGLWRDEYGNWSIDRSRWESDLSNAVKLGLDNDQRAIWDIALDRAINLPTDPTILN